MTLTLSPDLSDVLLRLAPVNVLLLDRELVCRYAAPAGESICGWSREDVIGRPVAEVLPPARNGLGAVLRRAAEEARPWHHPEYRFTVAQQQNASGCWSVAVDPVATPEFHGVLVSWTEIVEREAERERLLDEVERVRRQARERNAAVIQILSDLRNAITPLSGYLQVIARRPETLKGRTAADVIADFVLPRVSDLLVIAERLRRPPVYAPEADGATGTDTDRPLAP